MELQAAGFPPPTPQPHKSIPRDCDLCGCARCPSRMMAGYLDPANQGTVIAG